MKMKISLREALAHADNVSLDDFEVVKFVCPSDQTIRMERADEMEFEFPLDVILDLSNGRAFTEDLEGEEHDLVFWLHRRLGET
jgi:hypothetical protein